MNFIEATKNGVIIRRGDEEKIYFRSPTGHFYYEEYYSPLSKEICCCQANFTLEEFISDDWEIMR